MMNGKTAEIAGRITLNDIYAPIRGDLAAFTTALKKELASEDPLIRGIHDHILLMSGKFLRPALALLTSQINGHGDPRAVQLAVSIELIHTATLVHDDIIDDSGFRRNQPSVHSKWGREISIVAGDYLYAKAFMLLAGLKDPKISEAFATCAHVMCEGEMKQIEKRNDFLMNEKAYLKIIHQKTAALFQAACMGGAYFSGAPAATVESLGRFGYGLGMAFQITDDCLDLTGETESLGKTAGLDIDKNDVTLPLLYLFQELEGIEREVLLSEIRRGGSTVLAKVKQLAAEKKVIDKALDKAREYLEAASEELGGIKNAAVKDSLSQLAQYCIERSH